MTEPMPCLVCGRYFSPEEFEAGYCRWCVEAELVELRKLENRMWG